jgi:hypothetical protein
MALRDVFLHNTRWKVTALVLATLVWFAIKFAIYREAAGGPNQILRHQPVMVLKAPDDNRVFRVDPAQVDVIVQSTKELGEGELQVFVDLTQMPEVNTALKQIVLRAGDNVKARAEPPYVTVERLSTQDTPLNNKP